MPSLDWLNRASAFTTAVLDALLVQAKVTFKHIPYDVKTR
jgi:hypothetical protein